MERDARGRPTRFDKGDLIKVDGREYVLGPGSANYLNASLERGLPRPGSRFAKAGAVFEITLSARAGNSDRRTFPVRQVLEETSAIDKPKAQ